MPDERCCGTCKFHEADGCDFVCDNPDSDNYSDWTGYEDVCDEWEEK